MFLTYDVVALGELLIDFTGSGQSPQGNPLFEANPGGAPGNVLAMLAKMGRKTAFIGKVGQDMFGRLMTDTLQECGIGTGGVVADGAANTTLAFVQNAPDGDREFAFFRKPGADTLLRAEDVDAALLEDCKIFHFGTLSLTHQPARGATQFAVDAARRAGALISFDPNLRPLLWDDLEEARRQMDWGCKVCDILKIAEEELAFLTGKEDLDAGAAQLRRDCPGIKIMFVTQGKRGARAFWGDAQAARPTFLKVKAVDTTGAGDTFCGSCLAHILDLDLDKPDAEILAQMITFANAAASLVSAKKGALRSMPAKQDVLALVAAGT